MFVVQMLQKFTTISMQVLEAAKRYDEGMELPEELRSRSVCADFIKARVGHLQRSKLLDDRVVLSGGQVDWILIGSYGFKCSGAGDGVDEIIHRCTGVSVKVVLGPQYTIAQHHLDLSAKVTNGLVPPNEYLLADFFTKQAGPHTLSWFLVRNKAVMEAAIEAQVNIAKLRAAATTEQAPAFAPFESIRKERAEAATGAARAALNKTKSELNSRRRISLAPAAAAVVALVALVIAPALTDTSED